MKFYLIPVFFGVVFATVLLGVRGVGVGVGTLYFFGGTIRDGDFRFFSVDL